MNRRGLCVLAISALVLSPSLAPQATRAQDAKEEQANADFRGAVGLHNLEQWEAAEKAWQQFVKDHPTHKLVPDAKYYLGICQYMQAKYAPAIGTFKDLIARHPESKRLEQAHMYVAKCQVAAAGKDAKRKTELLTAAVATLNAQLTKWPTGSMAGEGYYMRGDTYYLLGKKGEALKDFTTVVEKLGEKNSRFADALYSIGFIHQEETKWEPAAKAYAQFLNRFDKAEEKHPLLDEIRMRYGETLLERQQFSEAEKWLQMAAGAPEFQAADHATSRLADSNARRKKHREAAVLYLSIPEKFLKLKNVDHNFARLEGGRNAYLAGEYELARKALGKVIPAGGDMGAEAAHWSAQTWLKQQKPAEARKVVEAVLPKAAGTAWEPDLMMDRGDALFDVPETQKSSVAAYYETYRKFPTHRAAAQALYNAAFAALRASDYPTAVKYGQEFREEFAGHALLPEVTYVEAESHIQLKNFEKAAPLYENLIKARPQHRDVDLWKVRLGQGYFLQGKFDAAVKALEPLAGSVKDGLLRAQTFYLLGSSLYELKRYDEAIKALQQAIDIKAKWPEADDAEVMLARALRATKDFKGAATRLRNVIANHRDSNVMVDARFNLAECLYELGDFKQAAPEYQWVIDNAKGTAFAPYALSGQAWTLMKVNDAAGAQRAFQRIIDEFPKSELYARAHLGRATASQQLKQFDKAEADYIEFLRLSPDAPEKNAVRHEIGKSQAGRKKFAEAIKIFQQILDDGAGSAEVLADLAWAYKDSGQAAEAVKRFQEVAEQSPDNLLGLEALYQVSEHLFGQKEYGKAGKSYFAVNDKAEKLRSSGKISESAANAWRERSVHKYGWCYYHQGQFENAEKSFGYQLSTYPKGEFESDATYMLAESQSKLKKHAAAFDGFLSYVGKYPEGRFVQWALLHAAQMANLVGLAEAENDSAKAKKQFERGLELAKKFAEEHPKHELMPEALYEQGWALQNLEQFDEALKRYEAVIGRTGQEVAAKARFMIGEIYFAQKKYSDAVINFSRVVSGYEYPEWKKKAMFEMARCLELQEKKGAAKKVYQDLIAKFPDSDEAKSAKERLKALGN
jgi:TolA-binding protein